MVSQMRPLFHTSTMRPRSSRLISLRTKMIFRYQVMSCFNWKTHFLINIMGNVSGYNMGLYSLNLCYQNRQKQIFPVCHPIRTSWTRNFYIITGRPYNWLITKATSSFSSCISCHNPFSPSFVIQQDIQRAQKQLDDSNKMAYQISKETVTRAFAYSHLWQFTTIDRPNKRKIREKIIKESC